MPTRNERLTDHYMRASGIAAVYIEASSPRHRVGYLDSVGIDHPTNRILYCCRGPDAAHVARMLNDSLVEGMAFDHAEILLRVTAERLGVALTAHGIVVQRASEAVAQINEIFDGMKGTPAFATMNNEFKILRRQKKASTYSDFLHDKKKKVIGAIVAVGEITRAKVSQIAANS